MGKIKGNKTLSGTWGELWVDGERIAEFSKVSLKVTANREDVQIDLDVDSKMTGLKGELSVTLKKVYTGGSVVVALIQHVRLQGFLIGPDGRHKHLLGVVVVAHLAHIGVLESVPDVILVQVHALHDLDLGELLPLIGGEAEFA